MNRTFTPINVRNAVFSPVLHAVSLMIILMTLVLSTSMARGEARIDAANAIITAMASDMDS